jgi:hypothetical protein
MKNLDIREDLTSSSADSERASLVEAGIDREIWGDKDAKEWRSTFANAKLMMNKCLNYTQFYETMHEALVDYSDSSDRNLMLKQLIAMDNIVKMLL